MRKSNFLFFLVLFGLICVNTFGAGNIDDTATKSDAAASKAASDALTWMISVIMPVGLVIMGAIIGYKIAKQKAKQSSGKLVGYMLGAALAGVFVYFFLLRILGALMPGEGANFYNTIFQFWQNAL